VDSEFLNEVEEEERERRGGRAERRGFFFLFLFFFLKSASLLLTTLFLFSFPFHSQLVSFLVLSLSAKKEGSG